MQNAKLSKEWLLLIIIVILVIGISILELRKSSNPEPNKTNNSNLTNSKTAIRQEKEENNVTVIIEYLPNQSQSSLVFRIALDTHTVNLDSFDFSKDITLEKEGKSFSPTLLKQEGSTHHRSAEITFPQTSFPFTIVFNNLANVSRREFLFEKL